MALHTTADGKPIRLVGPDYLHHYPCFKKVQLAAVKHGIFHPNLPTLRRMEGDNMLCKLPDEHSRTTTSCTVRDFAEAEVRACKPPARTLHCLDVTETGRRLNRKYVTMDQLQRQAKIWSRYMNDAGLFKERPEDRLFQKVNSDVSDYHFDGCCVRLMKPRYRDWRFTFKCEPRPDPNFYPQQQPTPSDKNSRYRHVRPLYYRDQSNRMWRDPSRDPQHPNPPLPYRAYETLIF